MVEKEKNMIKL